MLTRREAGPSAASSCSPFLQLCLSSFLFSHCDRKNKYPFALPTSAMGQKGKAHGVRVLGLGEHRAQHKGSEWGKDMGLGDGGFKWGLEV